MNPRLYAFVHSRDVRPATNFPNWWDASTPAMHFTLHPWLLGCIHSQAQRKAKRELEGAEHELGDAQRIGRGGNANAGADRAEDVAPGAERSGQALDCPVPALIVLAHQQS